jgi:hypothetical protein
VSFYPRRVDSASAILYTLPSAIQLPALTTISLNGSWSDPLYQASQTNLRSGSTPASGTDYAAYANQDGSGASYTGNITITSFNAYSNNFVATLYNNGASCWLTKFNIRGYGSYMYTPLQITTEDTDSQTENGLYEQTLTLDYITDWSMAFLLNQDLLNCYAEPRLDINKLDFHANKNSDLLNLFFYADNGNRVLITDTKASVNQDFIILGISFSANPRGKIIDFSFYLRNIDYINAGV